MLETIFEQDKQINSGDKQKIVISNKDPMELDIFSDIISEIEYSLSELRILALDTNFSNLSERQNYYNNITHLKRFYERAERVLLNVN